MTISSISSVSSTKKMCQNVENIDENQQFLFKEKFNKSCHYKNDALV